MSEVESSSSRCDNGELSADVPVTDDAKPTTADLVAADSRLVPHSRVHVTVLIGQSPCQGDDLGQCELHDTSGVREGSVEHRDPSSSGCSEIDLVRTDAESADCDESGALLEHRLGELRL